MPLDQDSINDLKQICSKELGLNLTDQEVWDMGISLVNIFKAVAGFSRDLDARDRDNLTDAESNR